MCFDRKSALLGLAALMAVLAAPAMAKPVTMQCTASGSSGWIADEIFVEYDEARDAARVLDGVIMHFEGRPKAARISEDTAKKLVVTWDVATRINQQSAKMSYRLAYFRSNGKVLVKAHPHGFVNNFTARGRCRQINESFPSG